MKNFGLLSDQINVALGTLGIAVDIVRMIGCKD